MEPMNRRVQKNLVAAPRLFSSAIIQEFSRRGRSKLFSQLVNTAELQAILGTPDRVCDAFDIAFAALKKEGVRDEYVYKSALIRRILLGRHSLRTASVLNEFRVGTCKADLAILNGTSTVYEVKSERDSLVRLARQVYAYSDVFASVYVVTAKTHLDGVIDKIPAHVGIMQLNRKFQISIVREAVNSPERTSPAAIFDSIRTEEARLILSQFGFFVPDIPNTELSSVLRREFIKLSPLQAHDSMVSVLKRTRAQTRLSELLGALPHSLHTAALSIPLRLSDHAKLIGALNTSFQDALGWG